MSSYDITFCSRNCTNHTCKRNLKNIQGYEGFVSMANFESCEDFDYD